MCSPDCGQSSTKSSSNNCPTAFQSLVFMRRQYSSTTARVISCVILSLALLVRALVLFDLRLAGRLALVAQILDQPLPFEWLVLWRRGALILDRHARLAALGIRPIPRLRLPSWRGRLRGRGLLHVALRVLDRAPDALRRQRHLDLA